MRMRFSKPNTLYLSKDLCYEEDWELYLDFIKYYVRLTAFYIINSKKDDIDYVTLITDKTNKLQSIKIQFEFESDSGIKCKDGKYFVKSYEWFQIANLTWWIQLEIVPIII